MPEFAVGQRFLSDAEPELGLGIITEVEFRTLSLSFPATQDIRRYAHANAPLTRITFDTGDVLRDAAGDEAVVLQATERKGLLIYLVRSRNDGQEKTLSEIELSPLLSLSQPLKRLLAARIESTGWFQLRRAALGVQSFIESSALLGLCSGRTELLPHQLHIANEVSRRPSPRVLLCDEVGLGKTIEACLILQQQLFSGLATRVLILVPDSLVHQWLVELLRRFNLRFTILDEERCRALTEVNPDNPFDSEQLVLCSREFLGAAPNWREKALKGNWDLLIVDEAHHLLNTTNAAHAGLYALVQQFAAQVPGLLLLTATPDQAGMASHFALLSLLDPQRFHDLAAFEQEQLGYRSLAARLESLQQTAEVDEAELNNLLDRHGTGRIVFRNTRKTVSGFPQRQLHHYPLPFPALYQGLERALQPERNFLQDDSWLKQDSRVSCLLEVLNTQQGGKLLVICHTRSTAEVLENFLRLQKGLRSAVFHEGLSLVERDRAAAYFAESENGAQVLVCSEIGSEGRNFQFCQHLFLFDIPLNPDLLEQRIGRLDRIGQQTVVHLHLPTFSDSAQAVLFELHVNVLGITAQPNPVAAQVCVKLDDKLIAALKTPQDIELVQQMLTEAAALNTALLEQHTAGRDKLLELNSCRPLAAARLLKDIQQLENEGSPRQFLRSVFANYGLDNEENSNGTWNVTPGADMLIASFPSIPDDGTTFTLNRSLALKRDDMPFVNWLHPMVLQSLDLVLQDHNGKATAGILRDKRLPAGTLVLESLYRVTVSGPARLQVKRWFPVTTLRAVVDSQKRSLGKALTPDILDKQCEPLPKAQLRALLQEHKPSVELLARLGQKVAEKQLPELVSERTVAMQQHLDQEIARLQALQAVNPQVQDSEISYLQQQREALTRCFADVRLHVEALRLLVVL
ncbi:MAG: RNA polymerase-associated protein RapA [Pseudomonadota bacterium]